MGKEFSYGICPYRKKRDKYEILLIQPKGHTEWGFIKGKIDLGETKSECAIRECLEETNIEVQINQLDEYFEQFNKRKDIGIYLVDSKYLNLKNIKLQKKEEHKIKFFDIEKDILINNNQKLILDNIKIHLKGKT
jgi:8-oxo-dGTP pyrophosphatase MutT (NUDIX family)